MTSLTIGVPVYNGADLLNDALKDLSEQTFKDFKVIIFDNASTDGTEAVARQWVEKDSRFHYVRHPENLGSLGNFRAALAAADTPWFMWRADDDLSFPTYVETLFKLATNSPGCKLAICDVISHNLDGSNASIAKVPKVRKPNSIPTKLRLLMNVHPSWPYGLWDTETLQSIFFAICDNYPRLFAIDHLMHYDVIIRGGVRTTSDTYFIQRYRKLASTQRGGTRTPFATMMEVRHDFKRNLARIRSEQKPGVALRLSLLAIQPLFLNHVLPSYLKTGRTWLRERLGMAKPRLASRHLEKTD